MKDKAGKDLALGAIVLGHGENIGRLVCGPVVQLNPDDSLMVAHTTPLLIGTVTVTQTAFDKMFPVNAEVIG
jgi:hypothetical protein